MNKKKKDEQEETQIPHYHNTLMKKRELFTTILPERLRSRIVDELVDEELDRRATIVRKAIDRHEELRKELKKKMKPDAVVYDEDGDPIQEGYSSTAKNKIKEIKGDIEKIGKLLNEALGDKPEEAIDKLSKICR